MFTEHLLENDCLVNFQKHYRLKTKEFEFLTYKDIIKEFELFLYKKYDIKIKQNEKEHILTDKLHKIKISISLYKEKWKVSTSDLTVHIKTNNTVAKLMKLKNQLENNHIKFTENKQFNNANEVADYLNETLKQIKEWEDVKVELNETFIDNSLHYHQNLKTLGENKLLVNLIYINLKLNNCSIPTLISNLQTSFEVQDLKEIITLSHFNSFLKIEGPHINIKTIHKIHNITNYTYQSFVNNYLCQEFYYFLTGKMRLWVNPDWPCIKLNENQNKIFTDGKNIVKLLVAKNWKCEQYIEYNLPVYWHEENKMLEKQWEYEYLTKHIFEKFNYPNSDMISYYNFKGNQTQKDVENLILESIKKNDRYIGYAYKNISLAFINPDMLVEKGHNIISTNVKIADFQFPVDFHINFIKS